MKFCKTKIESTRGVYVCVEYVSTSERYANARYALSCHSMLRVSLLRVRMTRVSMLRVSITRVHILHSANVQGVKDELI